MAIMSTVVAAPRRTLESLGDQALFYWKTARYSAHALRSYNRETMRLIAEIGMGTGTLAVIGGTVVIVGFMTFAGGTLAAIQGFNSLGNIGVDALTGFFAAFCNVRIMAPITAGIALSATIGAGSTAQLGAMRISEEIDALEVAGIRSMSYLVSTRVIAGVVAIIPIYSVAVIMSFLAARVITVDIYGQSSGVYDHYFFTFLRPSDLFWSFLQALLMANVVMLIHCYYGYRAAGGPAGVGEAVGRAVRTSLAVVVMVVLFASLAIYGVSGKFDLAG
ncbi:ABC transporter permease [Nocardia sp. 852002-20019_SCH5090214]|uniref:ABC transporter permease n=1 Tax=Nocardia nova TaxID=37330 RepID=A0A2S6A6W8_9NOCA|nr:MULTISPECIES: ABC transporter permease [Nocardia]MBV7707058.1 ABC transporter permease [Nocardia nova]OBA55267.1 ABC transporter permease [Nocardia sp. 852002-20019_SCH5090214]PPI89261.1 ABC transporter permease [Nocardia nova]PPJ28231.1 ABC transporter permease [Nocardia nova]